MPGARDHRYQHDRERVVTDDLALVLERARSEWNANNPVPGVEMGMRSHDPDRVIPEPFLTWLSTQLDLPEKMLWRIFARESYTTSYYLADRILAPLNLTHKLATGEIRSIDASQLRGRTGSSGRGNIGKKGSKMFNNLEEFQEFLDSIGCRR